MFTKDGRVFTDAREFSDSGSVQACILRGKSVHPSLLIRSIIFRFWVLFRNVLFPAPLSVNSTQVGEKLTSLDIFGTIK